MAHSEGRPERTAGGAETGIPVEQCVLVQDEVWRIVSEAARDGARLSLSRQAKAIAKAFPDAGVTSDLVADALVFAAVDRGVAIEARRSMPAIDVPGILALVGGKRKSRDRRKAGSGLTGLAVPAT